MKVAVCARNQVYNVLAFKAEFDADRASRLVWGLCSDKAVLDELGLARSRD
jgi:hypothetical protein